jgi:signal transduction histidine kinase
MSTLRGLGLRVLLATTVSCCTVWAAYELIWIDWQYDLESAALAKELAVRGEGLKAQFAALPPDAWPATVDRYNRESDDLLLLIEPQDPDWADLFGRIGANGTEGVYVVEQESMALIQLPGQQSILRNEVFYFESEADYDWVFWIFLLAALLISAGLLRTVLGPLERRLLAIADAADRYRTDGQRVRLPAVGNDPLSLAEKGINDLTGHLRTAVEDLQQSIGNQRDLLHAVAHEFRSPIARLRFAHDMLEDAESGGDRDQLLAKIDHSIEELDELVREVLGYSRIRHGGYSLSYAEVDLAEALNRVLEKVRVVYPAVSFAIDVQPDTRVQVDVRMLERAVINLVRNGARFAQSSVAISTAADETHFAIRVEDDGPGIPPGKRQRIFEPFTRLDASRSRDSGGSGLGLAIVRAISEQHGGEVSLGDAKLGGARFELAWPRQRPRPTE